MISNCRSTADRRSGLLRYVSRSSSATKSPMRSEARLASQRYLRGSRGIERFSLVEGMCTEVRVFDSSGADDVDRRAEDAFEAYFS
jgi:hypothetical protein